MYIEALVELGIANCTVMSLPTSDNSTCEISLSNITVKMLIFSD